MTNWYTYKLGELINVQNGYAFKSGNLKVSGIPVIKIKNIQPPNISLVEVECYPHEITAKLNQFIVKKKDILISMTGSHVSQISSAVGKVGRYGFDSPALLNQRVGKLFSTDINILNNDFLYYYISRPEIQLELATNAGGSANQANISPQHIKALNIEIPEIEAQRRIAEILSALDDKIEFNRRRNQTLEQMAQTLFRQYFVDGVDADNLPVGWRLGKLGEIVDVKGGTTPSTKQKEFWNGNISWTSPKDLSSLRSPVLLQTEKKITGAGLKKVSSGLLPIGTLLLSSRAPIGYLAITQISVAINQGYIAIMCDNGYTNYFMLNWIKENMNLIIQNANGSTFLEISKSAFKNIDMLIPPVGLVKEYSSNVDSIYRRLILNEKEIATLTKTRDTLLPKLMSGEIDVMQAQKDYEPVLS